MEQLRNRLIRLQDEAPSCYKEIVLSGMPSAHKISDHTGDTALKMAEVYIDLRETLKAIEYTKRALREYFGTLDTELAEMLELRYIFNMTYGQIARELNKKKTYTYERVTDHLKNNLHNM